MSDAGNQIQTAFHNKANETFFALYNAFENAVSNISRRKNEYRFQELKKQYALTLEKELQVVARDVLSIYQGEKQAKGLDQMMNQFIRDYLHRFIQKINDL